MISGAQPKILLTQTQANTKTGDWEDKRISLHTDELDVFFACLNHLKYF